MSKISRVVRSTVKQASQFPGRVIGVAADGKATVQLSKNGATYRNLPVVGGPVIMNQTVLVDFTTSVPTIVAPGVQNAGLQTKASLTRKSAVRSGEDPYANLITVYAGPPPASGRPGTLPKATYPATDTGLTNAINGAISGDAIYLPAGTISGEHSFPSQNTQTYGYKENLWLIGDSQSTSILTGWLKVGLNCTVRDLTVEVSGAPAVGSYLYALTAAGDCDLFNVYLKSTATSGSGVCLGSFYETHVYATNCKFESSHYKVARFDANYDGCLGYTHIMQSGLWYGNPDDIPDITTDWPKVNFPELTKDTGHGYYLRDALAMTLLCFPKDLVDGSCIYLEAKINSGETVTDPQFQITSFVGYFNSYPEWVITYEDWVIPDTDTSFVEYVNGVPGDSYGVGDRIRWKIEGFPNELRDFVGFSYGRYMDDNLSMAAFQTEFVRVWVESPDGSKFNLFPTRGYFYLTGCEFVSGGTWDLYMGTGSLAVVDRCNVSTYYGDVIFTHAGEQAVLISETEPLATYPGMMWLQNTATPILQIRDNNDENWFVFTSGSGGSGATAFVDLTDVDMAGITDGQVVQWSQSQNKYIPYAPLGFSGLSMITVSSGSPGSPTVGDLWIDIS